MRRKSLTPHSNYIVIISYYYSFELATLHAAHERLSRFVPTKSVADPPQTAPSLASRQTEKQEVAWYYSPVRLKVPQVVHFISCIAA